MLKEIKEGRNKWKDIPCSQVERLNLFKMPVLAKTNCGFSAIPIKIPVTLFTEIFRKTHPKIHLDSQGTLNTQNTLEKEQSWRTKLPDFKTYYKPS